ncbi:septal ring lytic transglycosylase RlpA family protein [Roseibacillus persicicus]|uniref:Probable endolytic peptidoglycan transglycosylase RlpA n=2 Tax=Roseibacillus persicicus TaxID=454148 RepID=A0A918WIN5_9BACT|nr:septal ring lytic transglycosylase RlpA family protein [Roseibacillus persicicus]GHC51096.1 hypothetical protein GCM10007100_16600 [Roseibacillus persicicus]
MRRIFLLTILTALSSCADRTHPEVEGAKSSETLAATKLAQKKSSPPPIEPRKKPNLVAGKYRVKATHHGKMSWYSVKTNGGTKTASGRKFSNNGATAAHRTLRFGTKVRVTNSSNGRSQIVTITDRGPFIKGRIIDVSIGTARKLGFVNAGVVNCKVEVLSEP